MSELKKLREKKNLTQEELSENSGISVRTIQRIEAGTEPKGYTLKTLAATLDVSEEKLLKKEIPEEIVIEDSPVVIEKEEVINNTLVKIINLSSLPLAWLPIANFLPPIMIMLFAKEKSQITKQIISLQIFLAIVSPVIFMIVALSKVGSKLVLLTIVLLTLTNIYIILRNAYQIDKNNKLFYKLNFNIL